MKVSVWGLFILVVFWGFNSNSQEIYSNHPSIRANGMGGVAVPFPSATEAIFVNPAALSDVSGMHWTVFDLNGGINGLTIAQSLQATGNIASTAALAGYMGKPVNLQIQAGSSFALPHFGFAAFDDAKIGFELTNPAYPNMTMTFQNDYGFMLGGAVDFGPSSFGMVFKRTNRLGGPAQSIGIGTAISPSTLTNSFKAAGVGYGIDIGYNFKIPAPTTPTISLVWHDVGDTQFIATDATNSAPDHQANNMILGIGGKVDLPGLDMAYGMEYTHAYQNDIQLGKKLNFGGEVSLPLVDLRLGLHQGYPTYGVGMDLIFFRFDASMYSEETGVYAGQKADNRIQLGIALDIGFDADFSISSLTRDSKKRKLKQRR